MTPKTVENQIWSRLKQVMDPELNLDIVSLGLVYKVEIQPKTTTQPSASSKSKIKSDRKTDEFLVRITMTLTTPGCPLAGAIQDMVREAVSSLAAVASPDDVSIELTFDPPWVVDMMTPAARAELGI